MSSTIKTMEYDLRIEVSRCSISHGADEHGIFDCISSMLQQEEHYLCNDYLEGSQQEDVTIAAAAVHLQPSTNNEAVDETCRSKMCEWIFHVIDSTRLSRETASVAMNYLDRYLCSSSPRASQAIADRKEYQLTAMTCFYIAGVCCILFDLNDILDFSPGNRILCFVFLYCKFSVKIFEPFEMDASLMSRLSRGLHSAEEITALEYDILLALQWRVNFPTPIQFINHFLELLPESAQSAAPALYEHSHFQTELAVGDYAFVPHLRQSTIGIASILNSLGAVEQESNTFTECVQFIREISNSFHLDIDSPIVTAVRERLLESFAKSSGYELAQGYAIPNLGSANAKCNVFEVSPACVSKEMAFSLAD